MEHKNADKIKRFLVKFESKQPKLMTEIALIAQEFFKTNFKNQGSLNESFKSWKPRKFNSGKNRSLLRKTMLPYLTQPNTLEYIMMEEPLP